MADDPWIWLKVTPLSLHSLSSEGWQNITWNFIILSKCIFSLLSIRTYFVLQFVLHFVVNQTSREAYIIMDYISKKCTVQNIYRKCLSFLGRYCVWYTLFLQKNYNNTNFPYHDAFNRAFTQDKCFAVHILEFEILQTTWKSKQKTSKC